MNQRSIFAVQISSARLDRSHSVKRPRVMASPLELGSPTLPVFGGPRTGRNWLAPGVGVLAVIIRCSCSNVTHPGNENIHIYLTSAAGTTQACVIAVDRRLSVSSAVSTRRQCALLTRRHAAGHRYEPRWLAGVGAMVGPRGPRTRISAYG